MAGILMGAEMQDSHDITFALVVPDISVYDPAMSDSLIPVGRRRRPPHPRGNAGIRV